MTAQWVKLITALRTAVGNPDMPVAVWRNDIRSHASDVQYLGVPFAALLQQAIDGLPRLLSKVRAFTSDGMEGSQSTPLPVAASLLFLRPDDYPELGERASCSNHGSWKVFALGDEFHKERVKVWAYLATGSNGSAI